MQKSYWRLEGEEWRFIRIGEGAGGDVAKMVWQAIDVVCCKVKRSRYDVKIFGRRKMGT